MGSDLYFRCEKCGGKIAGADPMNYIAPTERDPMPLRKILSQRKKETGAQLCEQCLKNWRSVMGNGQKGI